MGDARWGLPPTGAQVHGQMEEHWRHFDNSVNAVSFGFVATAILISMFLVMAIFERFLRPRSTGFSPSHGWNHGDLEAQVTFNRKLNRSSPKMSVYAKGVSVLMPGEEVPTFIAHPAPAACPRERIAWPHHLDGRGSNPTSNASSVVASDSSSP